MVNVAIVGAGGIGKFHSTVYTLLPNTKVIAVADIRPEHAREAAKAHDARVYTSLKDMLAHEKADYIDICTPTYLHPEMALRCMKKGLNVLCEKPMALDLKSGKAMAAAAAKKGVLFMVAQVIRFWDEYLYLKKVYQDKTYGRLRQVSFSRTCQVPMWSWENWFQDANKSGKALFDLHIHDADFIYYLLGKPEAVQSTWIDEENNPRISYIRTEYHYAEDIRVWAEGGWYSASLPFLATFRAVFNDAALDFRSDGRLMCYPAKGEPHPVEVGKPITAPSSINIDSMRPYYNEIRYFVECVETHTQPQVVTPQESSQCLEMVLKEIRSARTGKKVYL